MNPEKLKAPAGLCGHHRNLWRLATARRLHQAAAWYAHVCLGWLSSDCTHTHESDR